MELKRRYRQTEIGIFPEDWRVLRIGDLEPFVTSGSRGWAAFYSDRGSPFIRITNLSRACIYPDLKDLRFVNIAADNSEAIRTHLREGDVLISITADIGIVGYVSESIPKPAYINQHISLLRFDSEKTSSRFISYFLASHTTQKLFLALTDSGAKAGMNLGTIQSVRLALPPTKAEQEAIAGVLSDTDALIESLEQLLTKKRQLKQGAMQEMLTGKTRLPGFSEVWPVRAFGELFRFSGGFTASRDQLGTEGHCYLHYGDIHSSSKSFIDLQHEYQDIPKLKFPLVKISPRSLLDEGDVVFVDASEDDEGTSKHVVIFNVNDRPFIAGLHTIVAKSKTDEIAHVYRSHCFNTREIKSQFRFFSVGTKVSGISKANIVKIEMPVPPVAEQIAIATILTNMDMEITALETKLTKARQLKQGMMQALLTGRIRLPVEQAP